METLRLIVRDAIQEYLQKSKEIKVVDIVDTTCDIADVVFDALGISEKQQDIEGAKVMSVVQSDIPTEAIHKIVNYLYEDEKKDAEILQEEQGNYEGHIFADVEKVENWLNFIKTGNHKVL